MGNSLSGLGSVIQAQVETVRLLSPDQFRPDPIHEVQDGGLVCQGEFEKAAYVTLGDDQCVSQ